MLGAVFSLLLAAASPSAQCAASYAPLTDAEAHVKAAEVAAAAKLNATATTEHDAAMAILGPLPWVPSQNDCEPKKFALTKMALMSRSLVVAAKDGSMTATDAKARNTEMVDGLLPGATRAEAMFDYPAILDSVRQSERDLQSLWSQGQIAWHTPSGADCAHPNVDPVMYDSTPLDENGQMAQMQTAMHMGGGSKHTEVFVKLDASGAILDAYITKSSGDTRWDRMMVDEARRGKYLPRIENCKPVASGYTYGSDLLKG